MAIGGRWGVGELGAKLPSWRPGPTRDWLCATLVSTLEVSPVDRVAAFDNDGTLACEKPASSVRSFLRHVAPGADPYDGHDTERLLAVALAGLTPQEASARAADFLAAARHPRFHRPYPGLTYQPMVELVRLLGVLEFTVFLVSDSSRDFLRGMASTAYGLAPEHVIGSEAEIHWQDGQLRRQAQVIPLDDGPGKPAHLWDRAGRLPLLAGGNAKGDIELLDSAQHALLVRHDDGRREYAYEDQAAMDAATARGWTVVSMRQDFAQMFGR
ncbi:MAG: haloacid dehalogenase-like hydrolase [Nostocoides sp.]